MGLLVGPAGRTSWTDQLDGPPGRTTWTDQLDGPARRTSWMDQQDRPVLFIWSLGQFAYSKTILSVCTLSQLPSPTKALFFRWDRVFGRGFQVNFWVFWLYCMDYVLGCFEGFLIVSKGFLQECSDDVSRVFQKCFEEYSSVQYIRSSITTKNSL